LNERERVKERQEGGKALTSGEQVVRKVWVGVKKKEAEGGC